MECVGFDYKRIMTVERLVQEAIAFSEGTVRRWIFERNKNGLSGALLKIDEQWFIDVFRFNVWLSLDKDEVFDFRLLRTKEQILAECGIKAATLENWLRKRLSNGLEEFTINKSCRRLYINYVRFNDWLLERNTNSKYGRFDNQGHEKE